MIDMERAHYLAKKYGVDVEIVMRLLRLSWLWQIATSADARQRAIRLYNKIVNTRCAGIDPLV